MRFKGWQRTSLIEYPGKVATVLFAGGCNFRCPFCYNSKLVLAPETLADIEEDEVFSYLEDYGRYYQALVVSGGEPTLDPDLPAFLGRVKDHGLLTGVETNGTNPEMLQTLLADKILDFVAMDIKAPLDESSYPRAAGLEGSPESGKLLEKMKRSINLLLSSAGEHEFRTTFVPGLHTEEDIDKIAKTLNGARRFVLQQFLPGQTLAGAYNRKEPFAPEVLRRVREKIEGCFGCCELRNL